MKKIIIILCTAVLLSLIFSFSINAANPEKIPEEKLVEICESVGKDYDLSPELLEAIAEHESNLYIFAQNGSCKGLMQINRYYFSDRMNVLGITDIFDPESNIRLAASYISDLYSRKDDIYWVLMSYNMGEQNGNKFWNRGVYTQYAIDISNRAEELEKEHGK
jgi:soluble lytic murein transglycosylase-like protein